MSNDNDCVMNRVLLKEMIECAKREVGYRYSVYPRMVKAGKMPKEKAKREQELMYIIQKTLQKIYDGKAPEKVQQIVFDWGNNDNL